MKVAIRADASRRIGSGHVARCTTLGRELARRGAEVTFIARQHEPGWYERVIAAGFELRLLGEPSGDRGTIADGDYAAWLGVDVAQDAQETLGHLEAGGYGLLIVDHYALDATWEKLVRPAVGRIMAIDDLADRGHDADLLLDQNLRPDGGAAYRQLLPDTSPVLSGPGYALLEPGYRRAREQPLLHPQAGSALVSLGSGTDPRVLREVIDSVCGSAGAATRIDVVDPLGSLSQAEGGACDRGGVTVRVHGARPDLVDLMLDAEIAVGAGGATSWERMCLGLPTVAMSVAVNQRQVLAELDRIGAVVDVGDIADGATRRCGEATEALFRDQPRREAMGRWGKMLVDGRGAERVAEALLPTASRLKLRDADDGDAGLFWLWANEPEVRQQALSQAAIGWSNHLAWFARRLIASTTWMFVLEADGLPVGQIRFDLQGHRATIDYSLDTCIRGRGWGKVLVELGVSRLMEVRGKQIREIVAEVKPDNAASVRVFEGSGFHRVSDSSGHSRLQVFVRSVDRTAVAAGQQDRGSNGGR